ncbi:MAG: hypothetical protein SFU27_00195 [Thermonemataceae bacterium]|nr:hypothetical protein [Thermonemataceae bacterium]
MLWITSRKIKLFCLMLLSNVVCLAQQNNVLEKTIISLYENDSSLVSLCIFSYKPLKEYIVIKEKKKNKTSIEYFDLFGVRYADIFSKKASLVYLKVYMSNYNSRKRKKILKYLEKKVFVAKDYFNYYNKNTYYIDFHRKLFSISKSIEKLVLKTEPNYFEENIDPRSINFTIIEHLCKKNRLRKRVFKKLSLSKM